MGLINKIKGILFEEIEEDEVVENKKETKAVQKPIAEKIEPQKKETPTIEVPRESVVKKEVVSKDLNERELFKKDNSFSFPDFDEEEFTNMSRVQKPKQATNVLEYERARKVEKKYDLGRYERVERTEVVEKKKFKPSPIISPVYGILNEDYKPEDIKSKSTESEVNNLDFDSVRKKAFGEKTKEEPTSTYYEETVTVKLKEDEEEKKQKVKTIDELLEDTSDIIIDTTDEEEIVPKEEPDKSLEDDTLENDLFDLIDSMYDNREEGVV